MAQHAGRYQASRYSPQGLRFDCMFPLCFSFRDSFFLTPAKQGWKAIWNANGGWVEAKDALASAGHEMIRLGVKTRWGRLVPRCCCSLTSHLISICYIRAGTFAQPLLDDGGRQCIGAVMQDGSHILADRVIMCAGAWLPS